MAGIPPFKRTEDFIFRDGVVFTNPVLMIFKLKELSEEVSEEIIRVS